MFHSLRITMYVKCVIFNLVLTCTSLNAKKNLIAKLTPLSPINIQICYQNFFIFMTKTANLKCPVITTPTNASNSVANILSLHHSSKKKVQRIFTRINIVKKWPTAGEIWQF